MFKCFYALSYIRIGGIWITKNVIKKINYCKLINFEVNDMNIEEALIILNSIGRKQIIESCSTYLDNFDIFILDNFFENI